MSFSQLPDDILYVTALSMDLETLGQFCQTSKYHQELCNDEYFWEVRLMQDFGLEPTLNLPIRLQYQYLYTNGIGLINACASGLYPDLCNNEPFWKVKMGIDFKALPDPRLPFTIKEQYILLYRYKNGGFGFNINSVGRVNLIPSPARHLGKRCIVHTKQELLTMAQTMGINIGPSYDRRHICSLLEDVFEWFHLW